MKKENFKKAQILDNKIKELKTALNCFTFQFDDHKSYNTNPSIIIEFDGGDDYREHAPIPAILNDDMIKILKDYILTELNKLENEFDEL